MTVLLQARDIGVRLGDRVVLRGVDLELRAGQVLGLIGPNGAGKTTLLRTLAGIQTRFSGTFTVNGRPEGNYRRQELARQLAYLPQSGGSYWSITVEALVMLGRLPHLPSWGRPTAQDREAVRNAMRELDVLSLADRPVTRLSGGERARVLLARALAGEPRILLADEPVSGLDPYHRLEVMDALRGMASRGAGACVVLHDLTLAARFCDRLLLLADGELVASGRAADVLSQEMMARAYRIEALVGERDGEPFVVPWRRIDKTGRSEGMR